MKCPYCGTDLGEKGLYCRTCEKIIGMNQQVFGQEIQQMAGTQQQGNNVPQGYGMQPVNEMPQQGNNVPQGYGMQPVNEMPQQGNNVPQGYGMHPVNEMPQQGYTVPQGYGMQQNESMQKPESNSSQSAQPERNDSLKVVFDEDKSTGQPIKEEHFSWNNEPMDLLRDEPRRVSSFKVPKIFIVGISLAILIGGSVAIGKQTGVIGKDFNFADRVQYTVATIKEKISHPNLDFLYGNFDASKYVEESLNFTCKGETEGYAKICDVSVSELERQYEENMQASVEELMNMFGVSFSYEIQERYKNIMRQLLSSCKYTVGEADQEKDVYHVPVEIEPLEISEEELEKISREAEEKYYEKYPDDKHMDMKKAYEIYMTMLCDYYENFLKNITYKEKQTITVTVYKDSVSNKYMISDSEVQILMETLLRI